jgi:hypothetical protein
MKFYATFASTGPLKNCYATIQTDSELIARRYLKSHFPFDWSGLYQAQLIDQDVKLGDWKELFQLELNTPDQTFIHPTLKECE